MSGTNQLPVDTYMVRVLTQLLKARLNDDAYRTPLQIAEEEGDTTNVARYESAMRVLGAEDENVRMLTIRSPEGVLSAAIDENQAVYAKNFIIKTSGIAAIVKQLSGKQRRTYEKNVKRLSNAVLKPIEFPHEKVVSNGILENINQIIDETNEKIAIEDENQKLIKDGVLGEMLQDENYKKKLDKLASEFKKEKREQNRKFKKNKLKGNGNSYDDLSDEEY